MTPASRAAAVAGLLTASVCLYGCASGTPGDPASTANTAGWQRVTITAETTGAASAGPSTEAGKQEVTGTLLADGMIHLGGGADTCEYWLRFPGAGLEVKRSAGGPGWQAYADKSTPRQGSGFTPESTEIGAVASAWPLTGLPDGSGDQIGPCFLAELDQLTTQANALEGDSFTLEQGKLARLTAVNTAQAAAVAARALGASAAQTEKIQEQAQEVIARQLKNSGQDSGTGESISVRRTSSGELTLTRTEGTATYKIILSALPADTQSTQEIKKALTAPENTISLTQQLDTLSKTEKAKQLAQLQAALEAKASQ